LFVFFKLLFIINCKTNSSIFFIYIRYLLLKTISYEFELGYEVMNFLLFVTSICFKFKLQSSSFNNSMIPKMKFI